MGLRFFHRLCSINGILLILALSLSEQGFGWNAPSLSINLKKAGKLGAKDWKKYCRSLGNRMLVNQGPFGIGMFSSYSCRLGREQLAGGSNESAWSLDVSISDQSTSFVIRNGDRVESQRTLPMAEGTVGLLADPGFADNLVLALAHNLPVLISVPADAKLKGLTKRGTAISTGSSFSHSEFRPPGELLLYHLTFDEELAIWCPEVIGRASLKYYDKAGFSDSSEAKSKGRAVWNVSFSRRPRDNQEIWAQAQEGRGRWMSDAEITQVLTNSIELLETKSGKRKSSIFSSVGNHLLDSTSSGYLGGRFGQQFLAGDELLGSSAVWGLLLDVRGGPLAGIRFYYDAVPRVTAYVETGEIFLEWSRYTAGMSFGLYPGFLVDRIDFTPKIGKWNLHSMLPIRTANKVLRQSFEIKDQFSLALEVGAEWIDPEYTIRSWASQDQSLVLGAVDTSGVATSRVGLDLFIRARDSSVRGTSSKLRTTLLLFGFLESIKLTAAKDPPQNSDKFRIEEIEFDSGFAGGGLAVSW